MKVDERIRLAHFASKMGSWIRILAILITIILSFLSHRFQVLSSSN